MTACKRDRGMVVVVVVVMVMMVVVVVVTDPRYLPLRK